MAKILENNQGRRIIRLSAEDIMAVVGQYQEQCKSQQGPLTYDSLKSMMDAFPVYLPEEV